MSGQRRRPYLPTMWAPSRPIRDEDTGTYLRIHAAHDRGHLIREGGSRERRHRAAIRLVIAVVLPNGCDTGVSEPKTSGRTARPWCPRRQGGTPCGQCCASPTRRECTLPTLPRPSARRARPARDGPGARDRYRQRAMWCAGTQPRQRRGRGRRAWRRCGRGVLDGWKRGGREEPEQARPWTWWGDGDG